MLFPGFTSFLSLRPHARARTHAHMRTTHTFASLRPWGSGRCLQCLSLRGSSGQQLINSVRLRCEYLRRNHTFIYPRNNCF